MRGWIIVKKESGSIVAIPESEIQYMEESNGTTIIETRGRLAIYVWEPITSIAVGLQGSGAFVNQVSKAPKTEA